MTSKRRLLAAIKGEPVDRVPWAPFLVYYWESLSEEARRIGQFRYMKDNGFDPLMRGFHYLYKIERNACDIREENSGRLKRTEYRTRVGTISLEQVFSPEGNTLFVTKHPVESAEDFKVLTFINEHTELTPDFDAFESDSIAAGEDGLYLPLIGSEGKTCFQALVEHWVGTEGIAYALCDYPEVVEECLNAMQKNSFASAKICMESSAEAFIFWEDSSTTNISPTMFDKYTASEIRYWADILHSDDRYLVHHACGHIKDLLIRMIKTGIDMIDSLSEPPTGNITVAEAIRALPKEIGIIGGIEPTKFLNMTLEELEIYVKELLQVTKGRRFILGNSDSCPPGLTNEKFHLVSEIVKSRI